MASESNLGRKGVGWVVGSRKCDLAVSLLGGEGSVAVSQDERRWRVEVVDVISRKAV